MAKKNSKRYRQALEKIPGDPVPVAQAVEIVKSFPSGKFDPTIELAMHLGIDPRQADQGIRGSISLKHGIGATRRVIAFCEGDDVEKASAAGAVEAGLDELVAKVQKGWMDFDVAVATPASMKSVAKLGRILGPQGKMPSPKAGTVADDVAQAVQEYSAGKVEYRNDDGGNLHVPMGKQSFDLQKLVDNIEEFIAHVKKLRPASTKGTYIKKITLAATMSPGVRIEVA